MHKVPKVQKTAQGAKSDRIEKVVPKWIPDRPRNGSRSVPKIDQKCPRIYPKVVPKWIPKLSQNVPQSGPKTDPKTDPKTEPKMDPKMRAFGEQKPSKVW